MDLPLQCWKNGDNWKRCSIDMLISIEWHKNISVQLWHVSSNMQIQKSTVYEECSINSSHNLLIVGSAYMTMHATFGQKCFLCHSIEIRISLEQLFQSSPFFQHCKGKSMTYLEMDIICSRFFLFIKYSSHPMIAFFYYLPCSDGFTEEESTRSRSVCELCVVVVSLCCMGLLIVNCLICRKND